MSRTLCLHCHRPENACICGFTADIANDTHIVVLQHPSEVSQTKGTITLLAKSLRSCQVLVGENFSQNQCFLQVFNQYQAVLLYPGQHSKVLSSTVITALLNGANKNEHSANGAIVNKPLCLVILDGTWKKAYRMYMLSTKVQQLPQVCLPENIANAGQYRIRKVAKRNALSSLEASCYALALLEHSSNSRVITPDFAGKYQPLLEKFYKFNQFQLSFRPENKTPLRKLDDS